MSLSSVKACSDWHFDYFSTHAIAKPNKNACIYLQNSTCCSKLYSGYQTIFNEQSFIEIWRPWAFNLAISRHFIQTFGKSCFSKLIFKIFIKELGPRTAKLVLSICLKMKMVDYIWKSTDSANGSLLISCL